MELVKVQNNEIVVAEDYLNEFAKYLQLKAKFEMKEAEFKEELFKAMSENGIKSYSNDLMKVTYIDETTTERFDSKKLKEEHPKTYAKYVTNSKRKAYLKFDIK